ncbi:penicillin-binding protein 1A [Reichenbachiella agariperforans]|uniref:Penicillin-binding protein 1A n=1 Tax=Reichenbachiella agariperforans TaxID=156994 RepID=A0A1M6SKL5_REIAG|nr:transglycosylase domain-containing protein [Reichenbachiella agariperforans]SHK45324.1 penicillin-binding protein 1A [Reichenbachiella agariperforans]
MAKKKEVEGRTWGKKLIRFGVKLMVVGVSIFALFITSIYLGMWGALPNQKTLENISNSQSTIVYDKHEQIIGKFYLFDRTSISFDDLPEHLVQGLVATEDARFYSHSGIDYLSMGRVLVKTLILGDRSSGGGSTISQQLAKNLFPREKNGKLGLAIAKIKEAITAQRLEKIYSKEDIITLYLNTVSFPDNAYGIESAARKFYNKPVSALDLGESASLIGSLKATNTYNPRIHPEKSQSRRNVVLYQMVKYDYLTKERYDEIKETPTALQYTKVRTADATAPYFLEQVRLKAKKLLSKHVKGDESQYNLYTDGLRIYTTLDLGMQRKAEEALREHMPTLQRSFENNWGEMAPWKSDRNFINNLIIQSPVYKHLKVAGYTHQEILDSMSVKSDMPWFDWDHDEEALMNASTIDSLKHYAKLLNAGFLALEPTTGAIQVWIGGVNHNYYKYDHVNQSKRQVGSTFKPFVYAAALESGVDPCDHISGKTITYTNFENWTPSNGTDEYDDKYLSMQAALTRSINTVAVKMMEKAGVDRVMDLAKDAGIHSHLPRVPSLALGTAELSMTELAEAYCVFVNQGRGQEAYMIASIVDADGEDIYTREKPRPKEQVISEYTYQIMQELLQAVTEAGGTGSRLRWKYKLDNDIAGKTGTTQSNRDGWFVGLTPNLVTVSWVGADNPGLYFKDTRYGQGANSALPIFGLFYQKLNADQDYRSITQAQFATPDQEVMEDLDCVGVEEENFFQGLFTKDGKPKEKSYDQEEPSDDYDQEESKEEEDKGVFKKLKKLFKRNK